MKRTSMVGMAFTAFTLWVSPGWTADVAKGKALHDAGCTTGCHATKTAGDTYGLYTRETRMGSLEKLKSQVSFCNQQVLNTEWWPEDEADVVEYLNYTFYKFK